MTHIKKLALLLSTAALALAFAIPATASAYTSWTTAFNGVEIAELSTEDVYEGTFKWKTPYTSVIECDAKIGLWVETYGEPPGASDLTEFAIDASSCEGFGVYKNCTIKSTTSNFPNWYIELGSPLTVRAPGENVFIELKYQSVGGGYYCAMESYSNRAEFLAENLQLLPTFSKKGGITAITFKGLSTSGTNYEWGPFTKVSGEYEIGLK
jgi:hypothetical protein